MIEEEFVNTQQNLILCASLMARTNLDEFIAAVEQAEGQDPADEAVLYKRTGLRLRDFRRMATAAIEFQRAAGMVNITEAKR